MSRRSSASPMSRREKAEMQFGEGPWALAARRMLYEHSDPALPVRKIEPADEEIRILEGQILDIERLALDRVYNPKIGGIKKDAKVLEIGTGLGALPRYMVEVMGHRGPIDAVDIQPNHYFANEEALKRRGITNVSYGYGNGENLSQYDDGSFDLVILGFMTYHAEHPELVFDEAHRVLAKGGILLDETRGPNNMRVTWDLQSMIAGNLSGVPEHEGILPPTSFYSDFDIRQNRNAVKARFTIIDYFEQSARTGYHLSYGEEDIPTVIDGIISLKDSFQKLDKETGRMVPCVPHADQLLYVINRSIKPYLEYLTFGGGRFVDDVEQVFIMGRKDKTIEELSPNVIEATKRLEAASSRRRASKVGTVALAA